MNKTVNKWAVEVGTPENSEVIQRLAFSFGYHWAANSTEVILTNTNFLIFEPKSKEITYWNSRDGVVLWVCQIVVEFDKALSLFKNPPNNIFEVGGFQITSTGDVIHAMETITSDVFEKVVAEREKMLGRKPEKAPKSKLPNVHFRCGTVSCQLLVQHVDKHGIEGIDLADRVYKTFKFTEITSPIYFDGLVERTVK